MTSVFSRFCLIIKRFDFYIEKEDIRCHCNLCDFAHYVRQRAIFDHSIIYDETLDDSIGGYSLFAFKFYSYIHGNAVDGFVLSQTVNDHEGSFMQMCACWDSKVVVSIISFSKTRIHIIQNSVFILVNQNLDSDHRIKFRVQVQR